MPDLDYGVKHGLFSEEYRDNYLEYGMDNYGDDTEIIEEHKEWYLIIDEKEKYNKLSPHNKKKYYNNYDKFGAERKIIKEQFSKCPFNISLGLELLLKLDKPFTYKNEINIIDDRQKLINNTIIKCKKNKNITLRIIKWTY